MKIKTTDSSTMTLDLSLHQLARLLEQAARANAWLTLTPTDPADDRSIPARIERLTANALLVHADAGVDMLPSTYCEALLEWRQAAYLFCAHVLSVQPDDTGVCLELSFPDAMHMFQRRRFVRTQLAQSTDVSITLPGGDSHQACEGALLNLSCQGLACRVRRSDADRMSVDDTVGLSFALGDWTESISLDALIKAKTPAAGDDAIILSLGFINVEPDDPRALRLKQAVEPAVIA